MARPRKEGMDYFPHDTDAANDEKIEALRSLFGNDGYVFYFIVLERVYRTKSAELDVSKPVLFASLAAKLMVTKERLTEMLEASFDLELLDRKAFESSKKITSDGIKKRFEEVENMRNRWRKRKDNPKDNDSENGVFLQDNQGDNHEDNLVVTPQSKAKESKRKESNKTFESYTSNPELIETLESFVEFRTKIKKPMTDKAVTLLLNKLDKLASDERQKIAILEQSIFNGWQGIFELKGGEQNAINQRGHEASPRTDKKLPSITGGQVGRIRPNRKTI